MNLPGGRSFGVEGRLCSRGESCSKPGSDLGLALPRGNGTPPGSDQPRVGVLKASQGERRMPGAGPSKESFDQSLPIKVPSD